MVHYIIVKWVQGVDKKRLAEKVRTLYADAVKIPGIQAVEIKENVTPRENRYDLMIALHMENDALSGWDNSDRITSGSRNSVVQLRKSASSTAKCNSSGVSVNTVCFLIYLYHK